MDIFGRDTDARDRSGALLSLVVAIVISCGCGSVPGLVTQYEYDETIDLSLDGSATVYVNGSVSALVALHGADLDLDPLARFDRAKVREFYSAPEVRVRRVTTSRRNGRRFVHVTLDIGDVRRLESVGPFSWARYQFDRSGDEYVFIQSLRGAAAPRVQGVDWTGGELVAFRLHPPSRVLFHNAPADHLRRGNILLWHQPLAERLRAAPTRLEVRMEAQSILFRTVRIFVLTFFAAVTTLAVFVWLAMRQGRKGAAVISQSQRA